MTRLIYSLALALLASVASAQQTQVSFLPDAELYVIDAATAAENNLFTEYDGFIQAQLFQDPEGAYSLEITVLRQGSRVRQVHSISPLELGRIQGSLSQNVSGSSSRLEASAQSPASSAGKRAQGDLQNDGRRRFLWGTLGLSYGYWGWAIPAGAGIEGGAAVGTYLITSGAAFFGPLLLLEDVEISRGMSNLALYGGTRGILHAFLIQASLSPQGEIDERTNLLFSSALSIGETALGYQIAKRTGMNGGTAHTIGVVGDFGFLWGLGTTTLLNTDYQASTGVILGMHGVSLAAGHWLTRKMHYSQGDAVVLYSAGALGGAVPMALLAAGKSTEEEHYALGGIAGSLAGLWIGHNYLLPGRDFAESEGSLIGLGTLAGALIGAGTVAIFEPRAAEPYIYGATLGALAGFGVVWNMFGDDAAAEGSLASLTVEPGPGLLASRGYDALEPRPLALQGRAAVPPPWIVARLRF